MIEFQNINQYLNPDSKGFWKPIAKAGAMFIIFGCLLFALKELIVGFLSIICFGIGGYLFYLAFKIWNSKYT